MKSNIDFFLFEKIYTATITITRPSSLKHSAAQKSLTGVDN